MKLRNSNYKFFYALIVVLICAFAVLSLGSVANRTYAEDDEALNFSTISSNHFVTLYDNGDSVTVKTDARTVGEVLERLNIELDPADIVDPGLTTSINSDNYHINIYRARPVIVTDGTTKKYIMSASYDAKTIAEAAGFTIYDGDEILLKDSTDNFLETGVTSNYVISHNGGTTLTVEEDIPYNEVTKNNPEASAGTEELVQVGELGRKTIQYKVEFVDGVEVSREVISEVVTKQPVDRIVSVGMKQTVSIPAEWSTCAAWALEAGVSESDLQTALTLIYKESGCRYNATNTSSGAYGIPQALPGTKMANAGADWQTNPVTQIRWMISYVNGRYGGWSQAWAFWSEHHWY